MSEVRYLGDDDKCSGCGCDPCIGSKCPGRQGFLARFKKSTYLAIGILGFAASALVGCSTDAAKVSDNLSKEADQFKIVRKIVVTNTWNGETLWEATGRCSIDINRPDVLVLICLEDAAAGQYKKHYLSVGGGNISWASTQLEAVEASRYHTTIIFKPQNIVPNFDISVGAK